MSTLKVQRYVNAMHHEATCRKLVEVVSSEAVNVRRIKGIMQEANVIMKVVTQSHVTYIQSVRGYSLSSEET